MLYSPVRELRFSGGFVFAAQATPVGALARLWGDDPHKEDTIRDQAQLGVDTPALRAGARDQLCPGTERSSSCSWGPGPDLLPGHSGGGVAEGSGLARSSALAQASWNRRSLSPQRQCLGFGTGSC